MKEQLVNTPNKAGMGLTLADITNVQLRRATAAGKVSQRQSPNRSTPSPKKQPVGVRLRRVEGIQR